MLRDKRIGALIAVLGLLANNYVYLHDILMESHQGLIDLGSQSKAGVVVSFAVTLVGIAIMLRAPAKVGAEGGAK